MADITIPDLDDTIIQKLKQRAWQAGLPLEEALRQLLVHAAWAGAPDRHQPPVDAFQIGPAEDGRALN